MTHSHDDDSASGRSGRDLAHIRKCPGCSNKFEAGGRGLGKKFCTDKCRKDFHMIHNGQGAAMAHLVKAWHATRHAKPGTREAAICRFARSELTSIASMHLDDDREAGRDVVAYVGTLMDSGELYIDRMTRGRS